MPSAKPALIFVWPYVEWGGAQIYCMAIMKLAKAKWDITIILPQSSSPELINLLKPLSVNLVYLDRALDLGTAKTLSRKFAAHLSRKRTELEILRRLRSFDPNRSVVHVDLAPWQSTIFFSILAFERRNVFFTMHNFFPKLPLWRELLFRFRMQVVSRLPGFRMFTSNKDARNRMLKWISPSAWARTLVTYTCVDPAGIEDVESRNVGKRQLRQKFHLPSDKFLVLTVGQFIDRKGRWTLLDAAAKVTKRDDGIIFVWVTPALPSEEDTHRIRSFRLGTAFQLILSESLGSDRLSVLEFFKIADCFVLPSLVEGLPIAVLEAMALGLPTISTNVFAVPEAVKDGETGILVEAGDSDSLAEEILRLRNEPNLAVRLGTAGREFVMDNFDEREASKIALRAFEDSLSH